MPPANAAIDRIELDGFASFPDSRCSRWGNTHFLKSPPPKAISWGGGGDRGGATVRFYCLQKKRGKAMRIGCVSVCAMKASASLRDI